MVEELRVPTRRIAVGIFTDTGGHRIGSMFVARGAYETSAVHDILILLNDERQFIPFHPQGNEPMLLLNKAHIERVQVNESASDPALGGLADPLQMDASTEQSERCEVWLAGGTRLAGAISLPTPQSESRVVDKLNQADRFVKLITDAGVDLVHTAHVIQVI